jgi:hypothetical protein
MKQLYFYLLMLIISYHAAFSDEALAQSAFGDPQEQVAESGSGLIAVEEDVAAGSIPVGSTAQVIVRFRNESARPIEFRDVRLYPSSTISADVGVNECAQEPLTSGAECAIIISVKGLQPGNWRVEMLVRHTGRARLVTARINGSVDAGDENVSISTDLEVNPTPVEFGTLKASRPIIRSVTIRNITANPIVIEEMFIDAPMQSGYDLRTDCKELTSGQACIASILWSPVIQGPSSGFLVIDHDGPSGITNVPLTGEFTPDEATQANIFPSTLPGRGVLVSSETEINFGGGINSQSAITVSLVNVGDAALELSMIELAGSENGLQITNTGCSENLVLEPTEACPLTVSWSPTKAGAVIDDVQIRHSGARGVLVLPVRGTADEAVNTNNRPIFMTQTGQPSVDISNEDPADTSRQAPSLPASAMQPVLDGYVVTSHSAKHAIIRGPVGSRIVADGKTTMIGGFEWDVDIVAEGVRLTSGANIVLLVFDRSLSGGSGSAATNVAPATGGQ